MVQEFGAGHQDGHKRLIRGQDFVPAGGSEETHARMQETMVKVTGRLDRRGKRLRDTSADELRDLFHDAGG